jgi:type VI secretion system secreted protein VgrG
MLISTQARSNAEEHVLSTEETQERLNRAEEQHRQLAEYAQRHEAQERDTDQKQISDAIKAQNEVLEGTGKLGELTSPHLTLASASGLETTARESIHLHSGEHTAITAERDLSHSVGRSWHAAVQEKLTIFIHRLGAKIIAAMGKIRVEAQGDELELMGLKTVTLQSNEDWVRITGKQGVLINGGGSYLKVWDGGIEYGTKEGWIVYSRKQGTAGPKSLPVVATGRKAGVRDWIELTYHYDDLEPIAHAKYTVTFADGSVREGILDEQGFAHLDDVPEGPAKIEYMIPDTMDPSVHSQNTGEKADWLSALRAARVKNQDEVKE